MSPHSKTVQTINCGRVKKNLIAQMPSMDKVWYPACRMYPIRSCADLTSIFIFLVWGVDALQLSCALFFACNFFFIFVFLGGLLPLQSLWESVLRPRVGSYCGDTLTYLEPQSRFGEKLLEIIEFCPQTGTAVLKGLR